MSTELLLKKLKRFLPNNTANKLLTDDLVFIEEGSVLVVRFNLFNELLLKLNDSDEFVSVYKNTFNGLIERFLEVIHENGGIFINLSDNKIDIVFTKELIKKSSEQIIEHAVKCAADLRSVYNDFVTEVKKQHGIEFESYFSAGIDNGKYIEIIFGNEKRKERVILGKVPGNAVDNAFKGKDGDIIVSQDVLAVIKERADYCKRKNCHIINSINFSVDPIRTAEDSYLNLKTSIIKAFLPEHIYNALKDNEEEEFTDIKKGTLIDIEFSEIHEFAQTYIESALKAADETEYKVFTDNYFFGLNKLIKKIFRFSFSFDGAVNKIELSKFGLRLLVTFSFPKTFENDSTNRLICVEEIHKVCAAFRKLKHRIVYFEDTMFASIAGSDDRAAYIVSSELTSKLDDVIEASDDGELKEIDPGRDINNIQKVSEKKKESADRCEEKVKDHDTIVLNGLYSHKVIGRNKEIIYLNQMLRQGGKIITLTGWHGCGKTRMVEEIVKRMSNENFHIIHSKVEDRDNIIDLFKYIIEEDSGITLFDDNATVREKLDKYFSRLLYDTADESEAELFKSKLFILYKIMYNVDLKDSIYNTLTPELRLKNLKEALSLLVIFNYYYFIKKTEGVIFIFDDIDNLKHEEKDLMQYVIQYSISHLVEMGNRRNKKGEINKISFLITYHSEDDLEFNKYLKPVKQELPPLKKDTMRMLLKQLSGGKKISSEVEKVILKLSAGNPFFLEQYFRFVYTDGMVTEKENQFEKTKHYKKKNIPSDIKEIVRLNLNKLSRDELELLQACSVVGVKFDHKIVQKYYPGCSPSKLEAITGTGFIKKYYLEDHFTFTHPIISEAVYASASEENRKIWHRRVAELLMETKERSKLTHANWLGHHLYQAGENEKAAHFLLEAYDSSVEKHFVESAYQDLQKMIAFTTDPGKKDRLILEEIKILYRMDDQIKARKTSYTLIEKYERSDNYEFYFDILLTILENSMSYSPAKRVKELLYKASNIMRKYKLSDEQKGRLYKNYAVFKKNEGNIKLSVNYITRALQYISRTKDYESRCFLLNEMGLIYESQFRFTKSISTFQSGLKLAEKNSNLKYQSILLGNLGKITYKLGKVKDSIKYYEKALELASLLSLKDVEGVCAGQLGNIYLETKDLTSAMANFERSIKIFRALNNLEEISYRLSDFGACNMFQKNQIEAEKCFNKAGKIAKEINSSLARAYALLHAARLKVMKKNYAEAEKNFKESLKIYREKKLYKRMGMIYYYMAEMFYNEIVEYEDDPFNKYKNEIRDDIGLILKYMKNSLLYSKKAKNIHFIALGYLLLGKILKRKNRTKEAILNLQAGHSAIKISDYSKLYIELTLELADVYCKSSRTRDALLIIKAALKLAVQNKDMITRNKLKDLIKELSE
jgi:tetratricopeptide (TPR) repeat protein